MMKIISRKSDTWPSVSVLDRVDTVLWHKYGNNVTHIRIKTDNIWIIVDLELDRSNLAEVSRIVFLNKPCLNWVLFNDLLLIGKFLLMHFPDKWVSYYNQGVLLWCALYICNNLSGCTMNGWAESLHLDWHYYYSMLPCNDLGI